MQKIPTITVFDQYFSQMPEEKAMKLRGQVDRQEIYAYEITHGKKFFDLNADELLDLISQYNKTGTDSSLSYFSYTQIASIYRDVWNFYIEHMEVIKNPWTMDKKLRGIDAADELIKRKEPFSNVVIKEAIERIHQESPEDSHLPDYVECLILLYYHGFSEAAEIATMQEDMIDAEKKCVHLERTTVYLSDRCFELLTDIHKMGYVYSKRATYSAISWHNSYFKFIVRNSEVDGFQDKTLLDVCRILNSKLTTNVKTKMKRNFGYRMIYLCGFYDTIVRRCGEEHTRELVLSVRNSDDAQELMAYAKEYGIDATNVTYVKKLLRPFI